MKRISLILIAVILLVSQGLVSAVPLSAVIAKVSPIEEAKPPNQSPPTEPNQTYPITTDTPPTPEPPPISPTPPPPEPEPTDPYVPEPTEPDATGIDPTGIPLEFGIEIEPAIYLPNFPTTVTWAAELDPAPQPCTVTFDLPPDAILVIEPPGMTEIPCEFPAGVELTFPLLATNPVPFIEFSMTFSIPNEAPIEKVIHIPVAPERDTEGVTESEPFIIGSGLVFITNPNANSDSLIYYAGTPSPHKTPSTNFGKNQIEILAVDTVTGKNVTIFEEPITLSFDFSSANIPPEQEEDLKLYYFDEGISEWVFVPGEVDTTGNILDAMVDHLTVFDYSSDGLQTFLPPNLLDYEVSAYSGASTYAYKIPVFEAVGGLTPNLTLRYNSQVADDGNEDTQASWAGMGWALDVGAITRDMRGTNKNTRDDTFILNLYGFSTRLLPIENTGDIWTYVAQSDPFIKITQDLSTDSWSLLTGDGLKYSFGGAGYTAKMRHNFGCLSPEEVLQGKLNFSWGWALKEVTDRFGNNVQFEYLLEEKGPSPRYREDKPDEWGVITDCVNHIAMVPQKITYGSFSIVFNTESREDYASLWQTVDAAYFYTKRRLKSIDLQVSNSTVKSILFSYASNSETSNVINPNKKWVNNSLTSTLIKIQEVENSALPLSNNGNPSQLTKPPISFYYNLDHKHINKIENGMGGIVEFTYINHTMPAPISGVNPVHATVSKRTETDLVAGTTAYWKYDFPTHYQIAPDDGLRYVPYHLDFRGFDTVTITSGLKINDVETDKLRRILTFHNDDFLRGKVEEEKLQYPGETSTFRSETSHTYDSLTDSSLWTNANIIDNTTTADIDHINENDPIHILHLSEFVDLDINWVKTTEVKTTQYEELLNSSDRHAFYSRETYTYTPLATAKTNRSGNLLTTTYDIPADGLTFNAGYRQITSYLPPVTTGTYWLSGLVETQTTKECAAGACNQEIRFLSHTYDANYQLGKTHVWTEGASTAKSYSVSAFTYHTNGNLHTSKAWSQRSASLQSEPPGTPVITSYSYDAVFKTQVSSQSVLAESTYTTSTDYDPRFGLPVTVTGPDNSIESAAYDNLGRLIKICAPYDIETGKTCGESDIYTLQAVYSTNTIPIKVSIYRPGLAAVEMTITGFGKLQTQKQKGALINGTTSDWTEIDNRYDGFGNLTEAIKGNLSTIYTYDSLGRMIKQERNSADGKFTELTISYHAEMKNSTWFIVKSLKDHNGTEDREFSNIWGRLRYRVSVAGLVPDLEFKYNRIGELVQTIYGGNTTSITYNAGGQKTQMTDPDMGAWTYTYDAQGNLATQTDAKGNITTLIYDGLNRLVSKTFSNGSPAITYSYDAGTNKGYRTGMTDGTGSTSWVYDARGRLIREDKTILDQTFTTQYGYNSADQVISMTYPTNEVVNFTYLPQGGVRSVGNYLTDAKVNTYGFREELVFGNGTEISYTYAGWKLNAARLETIQAGSSVNQTAGLMDLTFSYDTVGNISNILDANNSGQTQTFTYDLMNRLTSASTNSVGEGQYSQSYSYDPATGNLASKSDVGAYTYSSAKPHAVTKAGTNEFTYDANGSMKTRKIGDVTWTYTYGAQNQLIEIKKGAQVVSSYGYDGDGNRVWSKDFEGYQAGYPKTTYYVGNYYEYQVTGKPSGSGSSSGTSCSQPNCLYMPLVMMSDIIRTSYYYADGQRIAMKKDGVVSYIYGDQLGSVSAVADASGNLISEALYHPWGTTRYAQGASPTDYGYTGQMKEGDIYFYNARWYDPQLGRFMQADTFVPTVQGTQAWDRFAYVNNNPMRYSDPSGHRISNTNLLMHDGGGGWDVPRFPGGDPYYAQGIREFGLFLVLPTSFTTRELQTIYNAQVQFASGLERLGVSDGRAWMLKNLTSFAGKNHIPGLQGRSFVLPGCILFEKDFTSSTWRVPRGTPGIMVMHELTHVFTGLNTYINTPNGPVTELMKLAKVDNQGPLLFLPNSIDYVLPASELDLGDNYYWRTAPAEFFSQALTALLIDSNHSGVPDTIKQFMIDLILGAE